MKLFYLLAAFFMFSTLSTIQGSPVFDLLLFGTSQGGQRNSYGRRPRSRGHGSSGGYNDYKRICKTINPDPYAFVGSNPYPAAPFCPP